MQSTPSTILVADDSPHFLAAALAWIDTRPELRLAGTARDGHEAVEAVAQLSPDIVLLDAFMPVMDGFEAAARIKRSASAPLVVILSAHDGATMELTAKASGADAFLPKSDLAFRLPALLRALLSGTESR